MISDTTRRKMFRMAQKSATLSLSRKMVETAMKTLLSRDEWDEGVRLIGVLLDEHFVSNDQCPETHPCG